MREFLEFIAKHLVDYPDSVMIEYEEKENKVMFKLNVAAQDVGKIIGRKGRTAQALRTLLEIGSASCRERVYVLV